METIYIETTVVSYLVALPIRDLVVAGHHAESLHSGGINGSVKV